ncbi:hypothetical protein BD779DRAFT_1038553 [Infundibulicybe gibba]|nr:hypothetical protein BD779DRAFT_1038553 [Infundibulicybe gibba]
MRLPPEVLSQILMFYAWIEGYQIKSALISTHVCRQWRQVGLDCSGLWSHINLQCCSVACVATMIDRSRAVPLSLVIPKGTIMRAGTIDLIANNMHRIKWLSAATEEAFHDVFFNLFSRPAPLLHFLTFSYEPVSQTFAFPSKFLSGSTPNLRYLKLTTSNSRIPWDSGLFANLVTLEVTEGTKKPVNAPLLKLLLSALVKMPGLEVLILHNCIPKPTPSTAMYAHVNLPNLKRLWMTSRLQDSTCFLRHLTVKSSTTVLISITHSKILIRDDIDEFLTVLSSRICTNTAQGLQFAWSESHRMLWIDAWTVQQGTGVRNVKNSGIKLCFKWLSSMDIRPLDLARACYAVFASPQLRSFCILGDELFGWDAQIWWELSCLTPGLDALVTKETSSSVELCKALCSLGEQGLVLENCFFPALSYLELLAPHDRPMPTRDGESPLSVVLSHSLATRAMIGCPTPELMFSTFEGEFPEGWSAPFIDAIPGITVRGGIVSRGRFLP